MSTDFGFKATEDNAGYYFISYNTEDSMRIAEICKILNKKGLKLWYDEGLKHGEKWEAKISEKIQNCEEMILFFTNNILKKADARPNLIDLYTYKEYSTAKAFEKNILIVMLDDTTKEKKGPNVITWWLEIMGIQGVYSVNESVEQTAEKILDELGFTKVFNIEDDIKYPVFNSVIDHPDLGDERQFIHVRQGGESEWHRSMKLISGKQYEIKVNFRNDADPKYNYSKYNHSAIATGTRMSIDVPQYISPHNCFKIEARITCNNLNYTITDSITIETDDDKGKKIQTVVGQSKIHNNWETNLQVMPSSLFSFNGALIGLKSFNGAIPGGDDYSGYVNFFIDVDKDQRKKQDMPLVKNDWGPNREMFTMDKPATYPSINSIVNNPSIGDERKFLRIGEIHPDKTILLGHQSPEIRIMPNNRYLIYVYCHNASSSTYFDDTHQYSGVATGIKLSCSFSEYVSPSAPGYISATITGQNTNPPSVWSTLKLTSNEDVTLEIENPAKIYNDWETNKMELPMTLFSKHGTYLGMDELDGVLFGEESHCVVTFILKAIPISNSSEDVSEKFKNKAAKLSEHR